MTSTYVVDPSWIEDNHKLYFSVERDKLNISVDCPNDSDSALCRKSGNGDCCVAYSVGIYGLEVNVGKTNILGPVEVAWSMPMSLDAMDVDAMQVWVVPINDTEFQASKIIGEL